MKNKVGIHEFQYKGVKNIVLENRIIKIIVLPKGGRIVSIITIVLNYLKDRKNRYW